MNPGTDKRHYLVYVARMGNQLEIGIGAWTMQSTYMRPRRPAVFYREAVREAQLIEDLGFDSMWLAEHHHSYDGYCPSPLPAAAMLLATTKRITIGTSVLVLPFHTAGRVAESCAALESVAPGRARIGVGIGYRPIEFAAEGVRVGRRAPITDERLTALLAPPLQERVGGADLWLGAGALVGFERAARFGRSVLAMQTVSTKKLAEARAHWAAHLAPGNGASRRFGVIREVWVDRDARRLEWIRGRLVEMWRHYSAYWMDDPLDNEPRRQAMAESWARLAVMGSPAEVVDGLGALIDAGVDTLALRVRFDGIPSAEFERCAELLAGEVVPQLRGRL